MPSKLLDGFSKLHCHTYILVSHGLAIDCLQVQVRDLFCRDTSIPAPSIDYCTPFHLLRLIYHLVLVTNHPVHKKKCIMNGGKKSQKILSR